MLVLALDIGGSSVKHSIVDVTPPGRPAIVERFEPHELATRHFDTVREAVLSIVARHEASESGPEAVGISTTGTVDRDGIVLNAGHFEGYREVDWRPEIERVMPSAGAVVVMNDGRASAWAEYSHLQRSGGHFAHFVVGTGVGGAMVVGGDLVLGDDHHAGYPGHLKVTDGPTIRCSCGSRGCVETLASAPAIVHAFQRRSGTSDVRDFPEVVRLAAAGREQAVEALAEGGKWLGRAVSWLMNLINPVVITLGGGVPVASRSLNDEIGHDPFFEAVVREARRSAHSRVASFSKIVPAAYGNDGGMVGVAAFAARG
ncbi:MAG: ROK family protein [Longimicrobiales bacterium]|nr:ROK family protein [Longimicrobiales bacterium]